MDFSPVTNNTEGGGTITIFETRVQCNQDTWNLRFGITFREGLTDPLLYVSLIYAYHRFRLGMRLTLRPYLPHASTDVAMLTIDPDTSTDDVKKLIQYTSITKKIKDSRIIQLSEEDFWITLDRIAIETNRRSNKTSAKRRVPRDQQAA